MVYRLFSLDPSLQHEAELGHTDLSQPLKEKPNHLNYYLKENKTKQQPVGMLDRSKCSEPPVCNLGSFLFLVIIHFLGLYNSPA